MHTMSWPVGRASRESPTFRSGRCQTNLVDRGDGDYLTGNTVWDLKTSTYPPTKDHTLQILMYWLMGRRSRHPEFRTITHLGIFNPRLNTAWTISIDAIPEQVKNDVDRDVIGYSTTFKKDT